MRTPARFTPYKGYRLYHPAWSDLNRDRNGRYTVVVLLKREGTTQMLRIPIPFAFGSSFEDAVAESLDHGKRLIDGELVPETPAADDATAHS